MAIGMVFNIVGGTEAQYQQVHDQVTPDNQPPAGMLYHAAGVSENGFCVIEVWESQEAAERFFNEQLGTALQEANFNAQPIRFQVTNTMEA
jgi:quinol monooxygenase YgiN